MSDSLSWFMGATLGGLVSACLWLLARHEGNRPLMRATTVAVLVFVGAMFYFGSQM